MKSLIVNADDFGFTRGVNAGIVRAFSQGIVTSTTIMANGDAFEDACELAKANPGLAVGCHLAVVGGRPVSSPAEIPSLVDGDGLMPQTLSELTVRLSRGSVRAVDIERELRAQVQRVLTAGISPTHLDTHKHSHIHRQVLAALARVSVEFGIKRVRNPFERLRGIRIGPAARSRSKVYLKQLLISLAVLPGAPKFQQLVRMHGLKTPDHFCGVVLTGLLDREAIEKVFRSLEEGSTELMCHPGIYNEELESAPTRLKRERERELEALTDPALRRLANQEGIRLISFRELT